MLNIISGLLVLVILGGALLFGISVSGHFGPRSEAEAFVLRQNAEIEKQKAEVDLVQYRRTRKAEARAYKKQLAQEAELRDAKAALELANLNEQAEREGLLKEWAVRLGVLAATSALVIFSLGIAIRLAFGKTPVLASPYKSLPGSPTSP